MKDLLNLFISFFKIGALTFGGGYAMLPMLEREIVNNHKWATLEDIMDYFAIGQCTPGVIAVNTATFIGYRQKRIIGGIVATLGVIAPSIIIICALAGISVAVCALLVQAIVKLIKGGIKDVVGLVVALCSLALSLAFGLSPIVIVIIAGVSGCVYKNSVDKNKASDKKEDERK